MMTTTDTSSGATVLVVDDDFDVADALRDTLVDEGYQVAIAPDGLAALDYLRANPPPALILLDWMMPHCDGATFRAEQRKDPAISGIPVVLLTADARIPHKVQQLQARDYLAKPVVLNQLLDVVRRNAVSRVP
jgi:CheY-like chemotaxis protein